MKIAIIGAGLIGCERIEAVKAINAVCNNKFEISSVFDINQETLNKVKSKYGVNTVDNIDAAMSENPEWVFIATPNDVVLDVVKKAFDINANVLMEKPFGRTYEEALTITNYKPPQCKLNVGFNYRFFAGVEAALADAKAGKFGKLISVNMILGHGNSPGMEKSWRFAPAKCGDCLTDLGVHLFDLMLQLADFCVGIESVNTWSGFWNTGIEEEAHIIATDSIGTIFNAQVSLNRWKSTFKLEINGTEGYGIVENRGRSYGPQTYRTGVRWGWLSGKSQAESEIIVIDKNPCVDSFIKETAAVLGISNLMQFNSATEPCDYTQALSVMSLLNNCKGME